MYRIVRQYRAEFVDRAMWFEIIVGVVVILVCICLFGLLQQNDRKPETWTLPDVLSSLVMSTPLHVSPGESRAALESRQGEIKKMMKILKRCEQVTYIHSARVKCIQLSRHTAFFENANT